MPIRNSRNAGKWAVRGSAVSRRSGTAMLLAFLAIVATSRAADVATHGVPQGNTWDSIKKLPDWSGVWQANEFFKHFIEGGVVPWKNYDDIPFTPAAKAKFDELKKISTGHGDIPTRSDHCISLGVPGDLNYPQTRFQWLFTPGQVTLAGADGLLRRIYTDGRPHYTEIDTFQGDSIGHWEKGGVLVVDTAALDAGDEFILGFKQGAGSHVAERFYLKNKDLLVDEVTLTAPAVLTQPWKFELTFARDKKPRLLEYDCAQNGGRDINQKTGEQGFDLSLPPQ